MTRVAIVGGGLLGVTSALLAQARGWDVTVFDRRPALWSGASASNEGKIHLGMVFALADDDTFDVMLRGALGFADRIDEAMDAAVPWSELVTDPFDYLVMPGSLLSPAELAASYARLQARFDALRPEIGDRYLGARIRELVEPEPFVHEASGGLAFRTVERAVDPRALGRMLVTELASRPRVRIRTSSAVSGLEPDDDGAVVRFADGGGAERFDVVVNCAWEDQQRLLPAQAAVPRNYRLKSAVLIPGVHLPRPVTLVQGPFGDVVGYREESYVSWYPVGRLSNEHDVGVSAATRALRDGLVHRMDIGRGQLDALADLGLLPRGLEPTHVMGDIIVGHGAQDIHDRDAPLHTRSEFGVQATGRIVTPRTFKLTTAPLAADEAIVRASEMIAVAAAR